MQPVDVTNYANFRQSFDDRPYSGEKLLVPFYTSLNADTSGTRKDIKKRSTVFFPVFLVLSYQKIKIFISYPLLTYFNKVKFSRNFRSCSQN